MGVGGRKYADAGAHLRINDGEGALRWGRQHVQTCIMVRGGGCESTYK